METNNHIIPVHIEDEMRNAYIDYAMSVIIARALPDVRDGLKPVHRRVLFGMADLGVYHNRSYKKSARIVGEVLGKYHPHGDASVYDTMVRMAQNWSLRYPLVDGQGNFGSIDGDAPAAMRYTEVKLKHVAEEILSEFKDKTIDFQPNFDNTLEEPTVLPSKLPNILVNGTSGIAVGMATNLASHNLCEVVSAITAYIDNPTITDEEIIKYIVAQDFPTGGIIYGYGGVKKALLTGRGRLVLRAVADIETDSKGKSQIIITEIPYQVNKAVMIEKTAALVNNKKIEGITDISDQSDRKGLRVVYELRKDAVPEVVLNNLYKHTALQTSFNVNNIVLVNKRPRLLNFRQMVVEYVKHRDEVIYRQTTYKLELAEKRLHILKGLLIALDNLDAIVNLVRNAKNPDEAEANLKLKFELSKRQAKAILDMRLQRLTGLERDKLKTEYDGIITKIAYLKSLLEQEPLRMELIKKDLKELEDRFGDDRRTQIVYDTNELADEDMIPNEAMVITVSNDGYIKRTPVKDYRMQGRGGVGAKGANSKEDDYIKHLFVADNHNYLLIFDEDGKLYWKKVYQLPEASKLAKGKPLQNLIKIELGTRIRTILKVENLTDPEYVQNHYLIMGTEKGIIKKVNLTTFSKPRNQAVRALTIREDDNLLDVALTNGKQTITFVSHLGRAVRFEENQLRVSGRTAMGVIGMRLAPEDKIVGMNSFDGAEDDSIFVVSTNGYGKKTLLSEYNTTSRGAKGVKTFRVTEKTGNVIATLSSKSDFQLLIATEAGKIIRMPLEISPIGRNTQGVKLIRLQEGDKIASVAQFLEDVEPEEEQRTLGL